MAKFCGKCGSVLNEQGKCPNCNTKAIKKNNINSNSKSKKTPILVMCAIIVSVVFFLIVAVCLWHFGIFGDGSYNRNIMLCNFIGDCHEIPILEQKSVLFSVEVNEEVDDNIIVLEKTDGTTLGYMNDNGKNGDKHANDGIYSLSVDLKSDSFLVSLFRASYYKSVSNEFEIVFFSEITQEEYSEFQSIYSMVSNASSSEEAEIFLKSLDSIEECTINDDSVCFRTTFGMTGIFEWNDSPSFKGAGLYAVPSSSGADYVKAAQNLQKMNPNPTKDISNGNIGVLRPFRTDQFKYDDFLYAGQILSSFTSGRLDCIDDSNVTVDTMKSLDQYRVVLIDSHGTLSNLTNSAWDIFNNEPYLLTGEEYSAFSMWTSADWQASRIVVCGTNIFYGKGYVAVGAKFFERYYEDNELENSIFFLGTCYSMKKDSIADVLIKKGAEVVFGYSEPVYTTYCNNTLFETIINSLLLSEMNANDAFEEAKKIYGKTDPNNPKCQYKMKGNGNYTIVSSENISTSDERDIVLVLDNSGSMAGTPISETRKASENFIKSILKEDASIGVVAFESEANMLSNFSMDEAQLLEAVRKLYASGGTNTLAGLTMANEMLSQSNAKKKIIVLMSDGMPSNSKSELIEYAKELRKKGIVIYTLGFFGDVGDQKVSAQSLMENLADAGHHYEVADADNLVYFFGDIADQISGQQYIYIRIACPVEVTVKYNGETLCSDEKNLNTRTDFGSLTFEERDDGERVKILRLKQGAEYDIRINGTDEGRMNYTIGLMNENGEYSDVRRFYNVKITDKTVINTIASESRNTVLEVDEDGDGKLDIRYKAGENSRGEKIKNGYTWWIVSPVVIVVVAFSVVIVLKKKNTLKRKVDE